MMKKSILELAKEAQENSKGSMSEEDKQFFLDYHIEQRQMLIIKAIERGVSMPMVDGFLGKRIALKGPNCWNEFFKTEEVRGVFRASKGIDNEEARAKVSGIWRGKTIEEQRAYATASAKPSVSEQGVDDRCTSSNGMQPESTDRPPTGNRARRAHLESLLTAEERALDDHSDSEDTNAQSSAARNMASISETPHLRSTVSFKQDSNEVQDHMDEWLKLATRIAARHSAEFIIFGVSNHLGPHAFQFMQSTPGATPFLQFSLDSDQKKHYPARFQSYITGHTENELAALARPKKKRRVRNGMSVTDRMHQLISIRETWPWTNTEACLADIGYKLVIAPNARIDPSWIMQPSRFLTGPQVQMLHLDLDNQLIDLVRIPRVPLPKRSRVNHSSSCTSNSLQEQSNTGGRVNNSLETGESEPTCTSAQ
ncbi:hypothetical protein PTTG_01923 [Puccinia triticina 1-1 BBBD Race 1]|uniref:Uncharacterized protein n=1 Tax=Puccinia triticina (isolate 1-1 / race 1 (BBBD)) TaxID=630390 RepID=A0A180GYL5_PUCT1|nr:hypothetical protein PTTG_01923 [Puccinia triticina 1-1 BBBD Race 1]